MDDLIANNCEPILNVASDTFCMRINKLLIVHGTELKLDCLEQISTLNLRTYTVSFEKG